MTTRHSPVGRNSPRPCIESGASDVELCVPITFEEVRVAATPSVFAEFYQAEVAQQVRRAALMVGSAEQANDIVHDAFIEVYKRWERLDQPGAYLARAVVNGCRDHGRATRRRAHLLPRLVTTSSAPEPDPLADMLDRLPFNQRAATVLRYYVGLSNREIAEVMGCAPGSVGPWITRALVRLRKELP